MNEKISLDPAATRTFSEEKSSLKLVAIASRSFTHRAFGYNDIFVAAERIASTAFGDGPNGFSFDESLITSSEETFAMLIISSKVAPAT